MENNNAHFTKVLEVAEKSIEAWAKVHNKIEDLSKIVDWLSQETKDLNNMLRQRPCVIESASFVKTTSKVFNKIDDIEERQKATIESIIQLKQQISDTGELVNDTAKLDKKVGFWLKFATGLITLIGAIITILIVVFK